MTVERHTFALADASPTDISFLSGAGISRPQPTNNPDGNALNIEILRQMFGTQTLNELGSLYEALGLRRRLPRLEITLAAVFDAYGAGALQAILRILDAKPPNAYHHFFNQHASAGGVHITANFDSLIERAMPMMKQDKIIHFHGSLQQNQPAELGARFDAIQHGFGPDLLHHLQDSIPWQDDSHTLFVIGYSGTDFYDMSPFLKSMLRTCRLRIYWLIHPGSEPAENSILNQLDPRIVTSVELNGQVVLSELSKQWGFTEFVDDASISPDFALSTADETDTNVANTFLFGRLGHRRLTIKYAADVPQQLRSADYWRQLAGAYFGRGEYASWYESSIKALALEPWGVEDRQLLMILAEARRQWIEGRLLRARLSARSVRFRIRSSTYKCHAQVMLESIEVSARIYAHTRMALDIRWTLPAHHVKIQASKWQDDLLPLRPFVSLESFLLAKNAVDDLLDIRTGLDTSAEAFEESDMVDTVLNIRHGRLRRHMRSYGEYYHEELNRLRFGQIHIGAHADVDRLLLLPHATQDVTWLSILRAFQSSEYSMWHKVRLRGGLFVLKILGK